jgi:hypothetical protein
MFHRKELLAAVLTTATLLGSVGCAKTVETPLQVPAGTILESGSTIWDGPTTSKANDDTYSVAGTLPANLSITGNAQASLVERSSNDLVCFPSGSFGVALTNAGVELNPISSGQLCTYASNLRAPDGSTILPSEN